MQKPALLVSDHSLHWVTQEWLEWAAHIVASEARGVPQADIIIACTMVRDVQRGWDPWNLRKRWFGWGEPEAADYQALVLATQPNGCDHIPACVFVGNARDHAYWERIGTISTANNTVWYIEGKSAVACIVDP